MKRPEKLPLQALVGIFFQSAAALMLEVCLSRLLSIRLWHHFAFLVISCGLFGYALAGSFLLLSRRSFSPFFPSFLFSLLLLPLLIGFQNLPFDPVLLPLEPFHWLYLTLMYLLLAIPFFFCGLTLNRLLQQYTGHAFTLYSGDLIGAACGCLGFVLIAPFWKEMEWLLIISIIGGIAALCLASKRKHYLMVLFGSGGLLGLLFLQSFPKWQMSPYKALPQALRYSNSQLLGASWNAVSRVDWFESSLARFAPGLSLRFEKNLPDQIGITIDGEGMTAFAPWIPDDSEYIEYLPSWILNKMASPVKSALLLHVVGGQDILSMLKAGFPSILAQTENSLIAQWLENKFPYPHIQIVAEKSRTYLKRSSEKYDAIAVSLENALPSGSTGMNALQESALETIEGMEALLSRLSSSGWLSIHRYLLPPPRAELRLLATLITAMKHQRWDPSEHLGVFRSISTLMTVVSAREWSPIDKMRFKQFCEHRDFTLVYYPGMEMREANLVNKFPSPLYAKAVRQLIYNPTQFYQTSLFNITPVTDDNPFFYHFLRWDHLEKIYETLGRKWEGLLENGLLIPFLLLQVGCIALLLILGPLLMHKSIRKELSFKMTYFFWIGFGFMGVEIALFEKLILFMGDPVYSFAVALGGLLVSSGLGAGLSRYVQTRNFNWFHVALLGILASYYWGFASVLSYFAGCDMKYRLMIAIAITGIPGILMGMPFPRGLAILSQEKLLPKSLEYRVAWAWCLNGCASVMGPICALWLAQMTGLASLFLWSLGCYGLALWSIRKF